MNSQLCSAEWKWQMAVPSLPADGSLAFMQRALFAGCKAEGGANCPAQNQILVTTAHRYFEKGRHWVEKTGLGELVHRWHTSSALLVTAHLSLWWIHLLLSLCNFRTGGKNDPGNLSICLNSSCDKMEEGGERLHPWTLSCGTTHNQWITN